MVDGAPLLDLAYSEDSRAESDMNVVMTGVGRLVEVQTTAEGATFSRAELDVLTVFDEEGRALEHRVDDRLVSVVEVEDDAASLVGVLDAKEEGAALATSEQPVEQRCTRVADVQLPGRTWCET